MKTLILSISLIFFSQIPEKNWFKTSTFPGWEAYGYVNESGYILADKFRKIGSKEELPSIYNIKEQLERIKEIQNQQSDPYGFMNWLNGIRARYNLPSVSYDQNLSNHAAINNNYGLGHAYMGPARRQNSAQTPNFPGDMWLASPGHASALLDPTIRWFGIAFNGMYWTFNAY